MKQDYNNHRFERLVVLKDRDDLQSKKQPHRYVDCECDCGTIKPFRLNHLRNGETRSCGCLQKELLVEQTKIFVTKHGLSQLPEYTAWVNIRDRCYNVKHKHYHRYGGRGITMSDEWKDSFETFYKDMGPRPSNEYSIERSNNDQGYSKDNCVWATKKEQANNRSTNVYCDYKGKTKTLSEWCGELGLSFPAIYSKMKRKNISFATIIKQKFLKIASRQITYNAWGDTKPPETMSLEDWCLLLRLDKESTYLKILRGKSFDDVVKE